MSRRLNAVAVAAVLAEAYGAAWWLGRSYGSTAAERSARLPGDSRVPDPDLVADHAVTIDAPPEAVWPWLVQVGWHRGGWYTARWVDRLLFPANRPSATHIHPELQHLAVGDWVPDGPPETECGFVVEELVPAGHLVLRSDSHLPLAWRRRGATVEWTWVFSLHADRDGSTRLVFRWRAVVSPAPLRALTWATIMPADLLMSRDMLRGIRARAEGRLRLGDQLGDAEPILSETA